MFDHLKIRNFKSIEHLELSCRRVNVLIGEPNTGKSNILEALGLISYVGHFDSPTDLQAFVRCDEVSNLFYDGDLSREIEITLGREEPHRRLTYTNQSWDYLQLEFSDGKFLGGVGDGEQIRDQKSGTKGASNKRLNYSIWGDYQSLSVQRSQHARNSLDYCKFYRFVPKSTFPEKASCLPSPAIRREPPVPVASEPRISGRSGGAVPVERTAIGSEAAGG